MPDERGPASPELRIPARAPSGPTWIAPMLATLVDAPFSREGWSFEVKWDGFRTLAYVDGGRTTLVSRNGHDVTAVYPELVDLPAHLAGGGSGLTMLDGELVVLDATGRPNFQLMQGRRGIKRDATAARYAAANPVSYVVFDLLVDRGEPLLDRPLHERRARLQDRLREGGRMALSRDFGGDGVALFDRIRRMGWEGIVGKRLDSRYVPGRSHAWLKVKNVQTADLVVIGWKEGDAWEGFGSLLTGVFQDGALRFAGKVGTGFSRAIVAELLPQLRAREVDRMPVGSVPSEHRRARWVRPELVAEVRFTEWTGDGLLRHPSYQGLRPDKDPAECVFERPLHGPDPDR